MRLGATWLAMAGLLGCGSASEDGDGDEATTSTSGSSGTTLPIPSETGEATTSGESTSTGSEPDPDSSSDDDDGPDPDVPPVQPGDCERLEDLIATLDKGEANGEAAIQAFFRDVAYGDRGFPMVETDRICFAYRDPIGIPLSVAGDFNDWVVGEHDLDYASPDHDLRYAIVEATGATGLYKFVRLRNDPEYFADPWARRFGWDEFGEYSRIDPDDTASYYERWPDFVDGDGSLLPRDLTVYVPPGTWSEGDVPVLYMHDGQNLFSPDAFFGGWRVGISMDYALGQATIPPTLVVGIDNTQDRFDEYTHVQDDLGGSLVGGKADDYADLIVGDIKPFIDERYPTSTGPSHTAVAGSSLGGLVSLYMGWRHPDVFGAAASMSGTVGWGSFAAGNPTVGELYDETPPTGLRVYVDSGGSPGTGCPNGDSDNYCDNVVFADTLRALGWEDGNDLFYVWEDSAGHNEAEWAERLPQMIEDWFPGNL